MCYSTRNRRNATRSFNARVHWKNEINTLYSIRSLFRYFYESYNLWIHSNRHSCIWDCETSTAWHNWRAHDNISRRLSLQKWRSKQWTRYFRSVIQSSSLTTRAAETKPFWIVSYLEYLKKLVKTYRFSSDLNQPGPTRNSFPHHHSLLFSLESTLR